MLNDVLLYKIKQENDEMSKTTVTQYIFKEIEERQVFNARIKEIMGDEKHTSNNNTSKNFPDFISDWQRKLTEVLINEEIIGVLKELSLGYSTSFAEKEINKLKIKMDLLDQQLKGLEETRGQLRLLDLWQGETKSLLNKEFTLTKYKHQLYYQATVDIDSIIDYI